MDLRYWLVKFGIARDTYEAEKICQRGSVRVNGSAISNANYIPSEGSQLGTLESVYTYEIPRREEILKL